MEGNNLIKKGVVVAVIILFIGMSVIPSTGTVVEKKPIILTSFDGNTLYVGGSGPGNYSTIQEAIDNVSDGDTVFVYAYSSPYYENVIVDKSIDLIGEDKETTVIDGSDYNGDYTVYIGDPYVTLTGFTIQKGTHGGILVDGSYGDSYSNKIYGNIIRKNNYLGIGIANSANNKIYRNNITNHEWGICAQGFHGYSSNNTIYQNNIMKNGIGIYFLKGFDGDVSNNRVYQNNFFRNSAEDLGSANQWDNGEEGNYWYDYRGKDEDGDGIGDKPYWIRPYWRGNKDNYPLMKPYDNITSYNKNSQRSNTQPSNNIWLYRLLERFPLLNQLIMRLVGS